MLKLLLFGDKLPYLLFGDKLPYFLLLWFTTIVLENYFFGFRLIVGNIGLFFPEFYYHYSDTYTSLFAYSISPIK